MAELTTNEIAMLYEMMHDTWAYIANDLINTLGRDATRDEVFEVVCDCGRMEIAAKSDEQRAVLKKFTALGWDKMQQYKRRMFHCDTYG